jgi:hypothetical protein
MLRRHPSIGAMPFAPVAGALVLPAVRYAATELRNAEAIARMFARKPALRLAMLAVMPVLWVAAFASLVWLLGIGRGNPRPADLIVMTVRALTAMLANGDAAHDEGFGDACCEA